MAENGVPRLQPVGADRRPVWARETAWAAALARALVQAGLRPNQVSTFSVVLAAASGACLLIAARNSSPWSVGLFLSAAVLIQLRLLCNVLDGLMAIEEGLKTRSGDIFNELPDRVSDAIILVASGYTSPWPGWAAELGWAAALLAVLTAYVRTLGASVGASQSFGGPMAKPHRGVVLTAACLLAAVESALGWDGRALAMGLGIVALGCLVTVVRRTRLVLKELESR